MSKALQRAARINQEGAELLEAGETSKALKCFRAALKHVNESCLQGLVAHVPSRGGVTASFCSSTTPVKLSLDNNDSKNYSQVFHFNPEGKLSVQKQSYCSAVLIFNCAVTLHQKGHCCNSSSNSDQEKEEAKQGNRYKSYMKALLFYSQALNLLRPYATEKNDNNSLPECYEMMQEIMKNQVDIYYKIQDLGSVQRVMEELVQMTTYCHGAFSMPKTSLASSA